MNPFHHGKPTICMLLFNYLSKEYNALTTTIDPIPFLPRF